MAGSVLVNFRVERALLNIFDAACESAGESRSGALRRLMCEQTGLPVKTDEASPVKTWVQDAYDKGQFLTKETAQKLDPVVGVNAAEPVEVDFYGKPLLPGFARVEGTWWARHARRPMMWIGETDADGNPLMED